MRLVEHFVATITYVVSYFSFSDTNGYANQQLQTPLFDIPDNVEVVATAANGPIFKPPTGRSPEYPGGDLVCDYSKMKGFVPCSTPENRGCWLRNPTTGQEYNITTDYEDVKNLPKGIDRFYTLNLTDGHINADGLDFSEGKFFWNVSDPDSKSPDRRYPGPFVQSCWGDTVHIKVINGLNFNGTAVHWHGIRQLNTMEADGVPGITQCPIAPGDNFTYTWTARQYGSSWYHSHFSLQYADGALGPLTIHGPSSDNWDEPKFPILMTDWGHNSAFQAIWPSVGLLNQSTLLNGKGNITRFDNALPNDTTIPEPYSISVTNNKVNGRAKRYLLRLINTSFESFFTFAVDNHTLTVVSTDFVSIHPYTTTNVTIGIGQRYNVILTAQPINSAAKSFWMRAYRPNCFLADKQGSPGYEKAGLVFYDGETRQPDPSVTGWPIDSSTAACHDEPYGQIRPVLEWTIANKPAKEENGLAVQVRPDPNLFPLALFSIGGETFNPLAIDYSNPIILNLANDGAWPPRWVVFPENFTETDWVFLVLKGVASGSTVGAHPIHLHGHDFAILEQVGNKNFSLETANLKFNNPPRRDVVLLPVNGYAVIAFRTDNPGSWIMHCHIAQHASFGLAMQILERQGSAFATGKSTGAIRQAQQTCNKWNKWYGDCNNWWFDTNPAAKQHRGFYCDEGVQAFSPDSGI